MDDVISAPFTGQKSRKGVFQIFKSKFHILALIIIFKPRVKLTLYI